MQPGIVLDRLNAWLKPKGLFFPVDVSPANRATIGGMAGNNSCGARSIRYGNMVHNVHAISAVLAGGASVRFGEVTGNLAGLSGDDHYSDLIRRMRALGEREADEIAGRFPRLLRRVGGYNIDTLAAGGSHNMAHLLVGSEGTLGFFTEIELDLQPIPAHRVLGVCHFPAFHDAMAATRHIVALDPSAVELVDRTLIELARDIAVFRPTVERFVRGAPDALLLVEFAGEDRDALLRRLGRLGELMADLGFPGSLVEAVEPGFQRAVWDVRKAGLNIMMSMKGDGKPVSFVEDCAVRLEDLAEYTRRLDEIFARHGTRGTWYAHASVGTLHVRPIIDLKGEDGARSMRAIAEECFEMVREYRGSHSGEHGDGIVRSEFHEAMFGARLVSAFEEVKDAFDPDGLFNPGKIVRPERMDDRELFRYKPGYAPLPVETALDWSEWGGFDRAVEMCNNNGACRKRDPGVMCPSYRATMDERHVTRGRANTLRLALTGQLGPDALTSDAMAETMALCVGCKGCRRECPTGVDMARMKVEYLHQRAKRHGVPLRDRLVAWLPRYAPAASRLAWMMNLRDRLPGLASVTEHLAGLSARRTLPRWRSDPFRAEELASPEAGASGSSGASGTPTATRGESNEGNVALFADTFTTWFEPDNARAAARVLEAAGFRVVPAAPPPGERRPLCCGRTFLAAGLVEEAKRELARTFRALAPLIERGVPIVGLEPSCGAHVPRRSPGARIRAGSGRCAIHAVRGDHRRRRRTRESGPAPSPPCKEARTPARSLPSEGVRRHAGAREHAAARARAGSRDHRVELLRHGRRLRLRGGAPRGLDGDGRAEPPAGDSGGGPGHPDRRGRDELQAPDCRRNGPAGPSPGERAGTGASVILRRSMPSTAPVFPAPVFLATVFLATVFVAPVFLARAFLATVFLATVFLATLTLTPAAHGQSLEAPDGAGGMRAYALWQQGYALHVRGRYQAAVEKFRESIDVLPTAEGHTFLGWSLSMLGHTEEAIAECKAAIALDPDFGNPYNDIGVYLIDLGRPDEAIPWLRKAIESERYCCYQFPHFNLGRVRFMQGNFVAARSAFEQALRHDPDYLPARMALEYLDKELGRPL